MKFFSSTAFDNSTETKQTKVDACGICKHIVGTIDGMLELGVDGIELIVKAIEAICDTFGDLIPGGPSTCTMYIDQLPQIIEDLVNNNLQPADVCKKLTMC